ncbi:ANK1 [Symbiodinium microadriaticum]|nr:ANK1 [Symbiodinium microadriaticum]
MWAAQVLGMEMLICTILGLTMFCQGVVSCISMYAQSHSWGTDPDAHYRLAFKWMELVFAADNTMWVVNSLGLGLLSGILWQVQPPKDDPQSGRELTRGLVSMSSLLSPNEKEGYDQVVEQIANRGFRLGALVHFWERLLDGQVMPGFDSERSLTNDVVRRAIIPESRVDHGGFALATLWSSTETKPQVMVTHNWTNGFGSLVAAILADALGRADFHEVAAQIGTASGLECVQAKLGSKLETTYWVCAFCINQHASICAGFAPEPPKGTPEWAVWDRRRYDSVTGEAFGLCNCRVEKVLSHTDARCELNKFDDMMTHLAWQVEGFTQLIVVDDVFDVLYRAWCVAEIFEASVLGMESRIQVSSQDAVDLNYDKLSLLDVRQCTASSQADKEMIMAKISDVEAFNLKIQELVFSEEMGLFAQWVGGNERSRHAGRIVRTFEPPVTSLPQADVRCWALLIVGLLVVGSSKTMGFLAPFALKRAVDLLSRQDYLGLSWLAIFAALKGMTQALNNSKTAVLCFIARPMGRRLAGRLFAKLLCLDLQFHAMRRTGEILRKLERPPRAVLRLTIFRLVGEGEIQQVTLNFVAAREQDHDRLKKAAGSGHFGQVESLLLRPLDPNITAQDGISPLLMACSGGHMEVVHLLLESLADANLATRDGYSPLRLAFEKGQIAIVSLLLQAKATPGPAECKGSCAGDTLLQIAVKTGNIEIVHSVCAAKGELNKASSNGGTALFEAASKGNLEIVHLLLLAKADANKADADDCTPICKAASTGNTDVVRYLMKARADINKPNYIGSTPLQVATGSNFGQVVTVLLQAAADANRPDKTGCNSLHIACGSGFVQVVRLLLASKINKDKPDKCGLTPLHIASGRCLVEVVRVLLEYSVNVNKSDVAKITPLHSAAGRGFVDIVRLLLTAGADVNLASERGSTPLHEASWGGHVEVLHDKGSSSDASGACHVAIVRLLLEYQADINFSDNSGSTALHIASGRGFLAVARLLVFARADLHKLNMNNRTPVQVAHSCNSVAVFHLLAKAGQVFSRANSRAWTLNHCQ